MSKLLLIKKKISDHRLLKWNLYVKVFSLAFIGCLIVISSCQEEVAEPIVAADLVEAPVDQRLIGSEAVIDHVNPETGDPYTAEELAVLNYDPSKEDNFNPGTNVSLDVVMKLEPQKIEVLIGDNQSLVELDIPAINEANEYVATFSSNFDDLKFGAGEKRTLSFVITYNNAGGSEEASVQALDFLFNMANIRPRAFGFLQKENGEVEELKTLVFGPAVEENGLFGHLFTFDGEDDYLTIVNTENLNFRYANDFSVSLWVKITEDVSDPSIIGDKDWGSGGNKGFTMFLTHDRWKINLADGEGNRLDVTVPGDLQDAKKVDDGQWHHLVASLDRDGDVVIYQDGIELNRENMSAVGDMNSGFPINVAQDGTGTYGGFFPGQTGEPIIYDYALSAKEVAEMQHSVQLRREDGTSKAMLVDDLSASITREDINGNGRPVLTFTGEPELLKIDDVEEDLNFRYTDNFTVAIWVNTTSDESDPSIIGDKDWGSGGNPGFTLAYRGDDWKLNFADTDRNRVDISGIDINDGVWHLIAATFDRAGDAVIYQDGVELGREDMSGLGSLNSGYPIYIAQEGTASYGDWFKGKTSNAYLFDYALTAEQMVALYNE